MRAERNNVSGGEPSAAGWRQHLSYLVLVCAKALSRAFFRIEVHWVGEPVDDPWSGVRVVALLNHTSLYDWLFVAVPPNRFLRRLARHGVLPSAAKTMRRPLVGRFFGFLAGNVVTVSRERDHTWQQFLSSIGSDSVVLLAPEGRMKRATGLDLEGRPMTVRGGIADILHVVGRGRMLLAYSGGLHHVQIPGQLLPRPFKTIRVRVEPVDIEAYCQSLREVPGSEEFKRATKADLERRRDLYCDANQK
ncbi:MAG TPA: 1-acyl-sn-glycerol-3-phosphate acyltransferase [Thermoanaerobaculia bacterium]|nr:1-acyl-sn-glycerol-3-phosphate acyltransferase [Thermoanaerobaculia bacterium]